MPIFWVTRPHPSPLNQNFCFNQEPCYLHPFFPSPQVFLGPSNSFEGAANRPLFYISATGDHDSDHSLIFRISNPALPRHWQIRRGFSPAGLGMEPPWLLDLGGASKSSERSRQLSRAHRVAVHPDTHPGPQVNTHLTLTASKTGTCGPSYLGLDLVLILVSP